jgi:hypothetical protein
MVGRILRLFSRSGVLLAMGCCLAAPSVASAQTKPADNAQMKPAANEQMKPTPSPDKPTVRVRVGEHGGFDRIVFDWSSRVTYRVESKGGVATIVFGQPGRLDLSGYRENPPPFFKSVKTRSEGEGVAVDLEIPQGTQLRHFQYGNSVVIDVLAPGTPKDAPAAGTEPAKAASKQTATAPAAKPAN